jgi:hypothetical protein
MGLFAIARVIQRAQPHSPQVGESAAPKARAVAGTAQPLAF